MTAPATTNETFPPVCILGLGLIGGSLLRRVAAGSPGPGPSGGSAQTGYGWSRSAGTREAAAAGGFTVFDDLSQALDRARADQALVVLAAPLPAFRGLLQEINEHTPDVLLTDVASVKSPVAKLVTEIAPGARYIGSHPMAGTQHSGWAAGSPDLFADAAWVTCMDEESDVDAWLAVARMALAVGSRVVPVEARSHDEAVARISHLPHLIACALAQVGVLGGELALSLAASSFADATRVAATRPELMRAMTESNAESLIDAMDDALAILGVARASLASTGSLQKLTSGGHDARLRFERRGTDLIPVELDGDDLIEQLLSVGAAGGYITGIRGSGAEVVLEGRYPDPADLD